MSNNPANPRAKGVSAGTFKPPADNAAASHKGKTFTREKWDALLAAYRLEPGNVTQASLRAGVSYETARKAWDRGWGSDPAKSWARTPILKVLELEQEDARARVRAEAVKAHEEEMTARLRAREDAIQARKEEAQGASANRKNALGLALVANKALVAGQKLVAELQRRVDADLEGIPLKELTRLLELNGRLVHRAQTCMALALQIERVVAGEPIAVLGVKVENMTPEAMASELEGMVRTMTRAKAAAAKPQN